METKSNTNTKRMETKSNTNTKRMETKSNTNTKRIKTEDIRMRMSVRELMDHPDELNNFLKALKLIQELDVSDPRSFWAIAGYHGEPFNKPTAKGGPNEEYQKYWGGYCQHSNVLFPTWHRCYLLRLENALNSVLPDITPPIGIPYWDQTSMQSRTYGIPDLLTQETVVIDKEKTPNPLLKYVLQDSICPESASEYYSKPKGYATTRYPFSGIMSPPSQHDIAVKHNEEMEAHIEEENTSAVELLNTNFTTWMSNKNPSKPGNPSIYVKFQDCLEIQGYNGFSNTSSETSIKGSSYKKSLEAPHNDIHLTIGGYSLGNNHSGLLSGANGDMGENETASFDPIFFIHHCNIDRIFWVWQKKFENTDEIIIDPDDEEGTNPISNSGQGLTPGQHPGERLTMDTNLYPFKRSILPGKRDDETLMMTSELCVNIGSLGYQYSPGSFDEPLSIEMGKAKQFESYAIREFTGERKVNDDIEFFSHGSNTIRKKREDPSVITLPGFKMKVMSIDRAIHPGSFVVQAYYKDRLIGQESVLNRFNRNGCANCQMHNYVTIVFDFVGEGLPGMMRSSDVKLYTYGRKRNDISQKEKVDLKAEVKFYEAFKLLNQ